VNVEKMNQAARIMRGLMFAAIEAGQSGHPGGSSSKVEQFLAITLGTMAFDPIDYKNPGRDRMVWSAGHCSPGLYGGMSFIYECLRRQGYDFKNDDKIVFPENLTRFRHADGPQGHTENYYPFSDVATGASGHGLSAALGMAIAHKSTGLDTKVFVFVGDAETEEGMTYEARNVALATGSSNLIVSLDYNHYGLTAILMK
jgi:transketolase